MNEYELEQARKRERQARDEAAEHEYEKERAERRAREADERRKREATAAREELRFREDEVDRLRFMLDDTQSALRREIARTLALVNAARDVMSLIADQLDARNGYDMNSETIRAWCNLQELCEAAHPRPKN